MNLRHNENKYPENFWDFFGLTKLTKIIKWWGEKKRLKTSYDIQFWTKKLRWKSYVSEGGEYKMNRSKEEGNKPLLNAWLLMNPTIDHLH